MNNKLTGHEINIKSILFTLAIKLHKSLIYNSIENKKLMKNKEEVQDCIINTIKHF